MVIMEGDIFVEKYCECMKEHHCHAERRQIINLKKFVYPFYIFAFLNQIIHNMKNFLLLGVNVSKAELFAAKFNLFLNSKPKHSSK